MTFLVTAVDADNGDGCKGYATVQAWRQAEGRVDSVKAIETIQEHVRAAVVELGGEFSESIASN